MEDHVQQPFHSEDVTCHGERTPPSTAPSSPPIPTELPPHDSEDTPWVVELRRHSQDRNWSHASPYGTPEPSSTLYDPPMGTSSENDEQLKSYSPPYPLRHKGKCRQRDERLGTWRAEVVGLLVSTLSLIALVAVLGREDGRTLSSWTSSFSVNTIVSILSLAIRTPLAFVIGSCMGQIKWLRFRRRPERLLKFVLLDEASRGPLGCLSLVSRGWPWHWASLGAFVTITLLVVDPFIQTLIVYEGQLESAPDNATVVARASHLDIGLWNNEDAVAVQVGNLSNSILKSYYMFGDIGMSATSLIGFVNTSSVEMIQPPSLRCRTGNCSWEEYSSLAVCSSCADVTHKVTVSQAQGMPITLCDELSSSFIENYTNYMIPYGNSLLALQEFDGLFNATGLACGSLMTRVQMAATFQPNETYSFQDWDTLLASFVILAAPDAYWNSQVPWESAGIYGTECALRFCAQLYNTTVTDGQAEEQVVAESSFRRIPESYQPSSVSDPQTLDEINALFGNALPDLVTTSVTDLLPYQLLPYQLSGMMGTVVPRNDLQIELLLPNTTSAATQTIFNITQQAITTMINFFATNSTLVSMMFALSNSTNFNTTFDRAAQMLTNRMREISGDQAVGSTQTWTVYIRVRWAFMAFPSTIAIAGLVFVAGTIIDSKILGMDALKSNMWAVLRHGPSREMRDMLRDEGTARRGADLWARLGDHADGLELQPDESDK